MSFYSVFEPADNFDCGPEHFNLQRMFIFDVRDYLILFLINTAYLQHSQPLLIPHCLLLYFQIQFDSDFSFPAEFIPPLHVLLHGLSLFRGEFFPLLFTMLLFEVFVLHDYGATSDDRRLEISQILVLVDDVTRLYLLLPIW